MHFERPLSHDGPCVSVSSTALSVFTSPLHLPTTSLASSVSTPLTFVSLDFVLQEDHNNLIIIMAPASSSTGLFHKDEKALCFHHELLYEAKVLDAKPVDASDKKGPWQYRVHYKGWKNT